MRVIAGSARGTKLQAPPGNSTRPTTDRSKQRVFDTLQALILEMPETALDVFAGSGALGIEALSRGVEKVTFVENDKRASEIINQNLEKTHLKEHAKVVTLDAFLYIRAQQKVQFPLIFADPPYNKGFSQTLIDTIFECNFLIPAGILILEESEYVKLSIPESFIILAEKNTSSSTHYFIQNRSD